MSSVVFVRGLNDKALSLSISLSLSLTHIHVDTFDNRHGEIQCYFVVSLLFKPIVQYLSF